MTKLVLRLFLMIIRFAANLFTLFMIIGLIIKVINLLCGFITSLEYLPSMIILGLISFGISVWATRKLEFNDF